MTKYLNPSFSVASPNTPSYRSNWDRVFRWSKVQAPEQLIADARAMADRIEERTGIQYTVSSHDGRIVLDFGDKVQGDFECVNQELEDKFIEHLTNVR